MIYAYLFLVGSLSLLLQNTPEKFQKIIEILKKKIDEMKAVLHSK